MIWGLTQEAYESSRYFQGELRPAWDRVRQTAISLGWTVSGAVLFLGGVVRRCQPARLLALGLFGMTVLKVFLFDLSNLELLYRVFCFGALGLALIGISWLYSRYEKMIA